MSVKLNHTIVRARDSQASAAFFADIFGLPSPRPFGPFLTVQTANEVSLDFLGVDGDIARQHYAFLVGEGDFDQIFGRVRERALPYWADPMHRQSGEINTWNGGRGVYFEDPNGHNLEILTRPYSA